MLEVAEKTKLLLLPKWLPEGYILRNITYDHRRETIVMILDLPNHSQETQIDIFIRDKQTTIYRDQLTIGRNKGSILIIDNSASINIKANKRYIQVNGPSDEVVNAVAKSMLETSRARIYPVKPGTPLSRQPAYKEARKHVRGLPLPSYMPEELGFRSIRFFYDLDDIEGTMPLVDINFSEGNRFTLFRDDVVFKNFRPGPEYTEFTVNKKWKGHLRSQILSQEEVDKIIKSIR